VKNVSTLSKPLGTSCQSAAGPPCLGGAEGWARAGRLGVYGVLRIPFRERRELL